MTTLLYYTVQLYSCQTLIFQIPAHAPKLIFFLHTHLPLIVSVISFVK